LKRTSFFFATALAAAGFWNSAVLAQDLPSFEQFTADLPSQAVPAPLSPFRAEPQYLSQAAALTGEKLFQFLHTATGFPVPGTGIDYLRSKKYMFSIADNTGCGGGPGVTCAYSRVCAKGATEHGEDYKEPGDANGDGTTDSDGMNAEHVWPQGFFNKAAPMKSDLHHIFPTFITPNNTRGSSPFGPVVRAEYVTTNGTRFDGNVFEPADAVKGDVARALFYFLVRYYDRVIKDGMDYKDFWVSRVPMFMEWNLKDPPDAAERRRNDLIERYQGNRNPFVDDPRLVEKVGLKIFQSH